MKSNYPYVLAIVLGFIILFLPEMKPFPIMLTLIYFLGGSIFGFLWPKESWRWGLWIVAPVVLLLGLSVLFAGQLYVFLKKDLPLLLLELLSACMGSFLSARLSKRRAGTRHLNLNRKP